MISLPVVGLSLPVVCIKAADGKVGLDVDAFAFPAFLALGLVEEESAGNKSFKHDCFDIIQEFLF